MSLIAKVNDTVEYPLPEPGSYSARCVRVIDLGTQQSMTKGGLKENHQTYIEWELFGENGAEESPFLVGNRYNFYLTPNSFLRKALENWRGTPFADEGIKQFDLYNVLGKDCDLGVVHNKVGEKTYANVSSILPTKKGEKAKIANYKQATPLLYFDLDKAGQIGFQTDYDSVPKWLQGIIHKSKEWPDVMRKMHGNGQQAPQAQQWPAPTELDEDELAVMPF
jgi:hypothetical protein